MQRSISSTPTLFVTGTDTGIGKTLITCGLVAAWRNAGHRVAAMKPIETGCERRGDTLVAKDAEALALAAGTVSNRHVCPVRFEAAASPAAAAALAGCTVDWRAIDTAARELAANAELLVLEGAGGLLVPIDAERSMADVAAHFAAPLLIVARASLGTINHTLLTVEAARARNLSIVGVVLNRVVPARGEDEPTNGEWIARLGGVDLLGVVPHLEPGQKGNDLVRQQVDCDRLWARVAR